MAYPSEFGVRKRYGTQVFRLKRQKQTKSGIEPRRFFSRNLCSLQIQYHTGILKNKDAFSNYPTRIQ